MERIERLRRALQQIAGGEIPRELAALQPSETEERRRERFPMTLLSWMQETARKALEADK